MHINTSKRYSKNTRQQKILSSSKLLWDHCPNMPPIVDQNIIMQLRTAIQKVLHTSSTIRIIALFSLALISFSLKKKTSHYLVIDIIFFFYQLLFKKNIS